MNNPKITSVGIAAALLLFSALLFGQRAEAWGGPKQDSEHAAVYLMKGQTAQFDLGTVNWTAGEVRAPWIGGWRKVPHGEMLRLHPYADASTVDMINWNVRWFEELYFEEFGPFLVDTCYLAYFDFRAGHTNKGPLFDYSTGLLEVPLRLERNEFDYEFAPVFEVIDCDAKVKKIERDVDIRTK